VDAPIPEVFKTAGELDESVIRDSGLLLEPSVFVGGNGYAFRCHAAREGKDVYNYIAETSGN
jgi:hypothetical protein